MKTYQHCYYITLLCFDSMLSYNTSVQNNNFMQAAKQNQKFPFHFLSAPPTPPAEEKEMQGKFLVFAPATTGSGRGAHHWSSGFNSKYIRTLSSKHRQKSKSHFEAESGSARSADTKAFPPPNPESKRVFHAPRGSSFANTIL